MNLRARLVTMFAVGLVVMVWASLPAVADEAEAIDFNRDVRPILSENCYTCHGPDEAERKAGLRLDTRAGALADLGGETFAVVPGDAEASELIARVTSDDEREMMPPPEMDKRLSEAEVATLKRWIEADAPYADHWSYVKPQRPELPAVEDDSWSRNAIDRFILARLESEGLKPSDEADRATLIRRVSLDLTGLPPTVAEVDRFVADESPDAYERMVDRMLAKPTYGEHWARFWLDMARYADSAGYADDPPREIWGYRDYVIRAFNRNTPFDRFTIDQLAGDLLEEPTEEQIVATAFHRNTQTNNEGGSDPEEYRNVAVVDRVNTTFEVWMGTTMACAQCHTHKYDPITLEEYFQAFAIFNQTADRNRRDEAPVHEFYLDEQERQRAQWRGEIAELEQTLATPNDEAMAAFEQWQQRLSGEVAWDVVQPRGVTAESEADATIDEDGRVLLGPEATTATDTYRVEVPLAEAKGLTALRLEALRDASLPSGGPGLAEHGNFVVTDVEATLTPPQAEPTAGRYVRIELPGEGRFLSLAEVQVFAGSKNLSLQGEARQSSTSYGGRAELAIDGNTDGNFPANSVTHTNQEADPWWELDLQEVRAIDRIVVWNRTDGDASVPARLAGLRVVVLDDDREPVWQRTFDAHPQPSVTMETGGREPVRFAAAFADYSQDGFEAGSILSEDGPGWAIGGGQDASRQLTLVFEQPLDVADGATLTVTIGQNSEHANHTLGSFRLSTTSAEQTPELAALPHGVRDLLAVGAEQRTAAQRDELVSYYLANIAPQYDEQRQRVAALWKQLEAMEPYTVPIMQELPPDEQRTTRIQLRGNFMETSDEVSPGLPAAFPPLPEGERADRLSLARWLVNGENPLTARVTVNRFWQQLFGTGIVATSEEFGSQGERPSHPELLDWLAVEFVDSGWDMKHMLRLMVTSAAYRQSSRVSSDRLAFDAENRLLSRGPRVRLSAEMVRDQTLFAAGLLSSKMHGPPVRPPQPDSGLTAAFGSGIDWEESEGEDRYRRGLYTTWRRSNPYPSMAAFDAPSREVCIVQRDRTNTPLQALVTLNDPVYIEAAQGLARRLVAAEAEPAARVKRGVRIVLARQAKPQEVQTLLDLHEQAKAQYAQAPEAAQQMATDPLGPLPEGAEPADLAAWTVVANVLLNLDEALMKR